MRGLPPTPEIPRYGDGSPEISAIRELPGPVGERNLYRVNPRGRVLLLPATGEGLAQQLAAINATVNRPVLPKSHQSLADGMHVDALELIEWVDDWEAAPPFAQVLVEDPGPSDWEGIVPILTAIAAKEGRIPIVQLGSAERPYRTDWLLEEQSISIDTTAAGGNASLMAVA